MHCQALKQIISSGLLSFPITDFDGNGDFAPASYTKRLEWLAPYGASALFVGGGTGEGFSLTPAEHEDVVRTAIAACGKEVPIIAAAAYGTRIAAEMARNAEKNGAAGLLLLPHYLTETSVEGICRHVEAVCAATTLGVIVYNRNVCKLNADALERLADKCPNLIGFKDGVGEIENMVSIRRRLGDRFAYLGGLPTAEVYAEAYKAMGVDVYSSAVFNFIPQTALAFYRAVTENDRATTGKLLSEFFLPYIAIRNRVPGYAVSIVKAGASIVGRSAGPVRAPLVDCTARDVEDLGQLIETLGPQA
ncbi:5-dehydro-4-deoxyglucarate dehydratase [Phyllobacterium zundukense]|uniref:Probable 5-dehydro-4-deoxyglucarate dehydratase n=1 Tax=Phyllobacterium zundukense TaxID=1867719 RepID=A0A2N9VY24_9HYPH|nr:5-dehydro-4-deoxyglucarate dehydratase [Phyllobacterium zundukense]ATU95817.1 5-dehydro-4-deoxyglucarate dehydratase [Phyllobacterium zundukense]PIO44392.1 5-dehydro-4-deoxyglucarate dehydratase [Phyllobacterium zundukense]